MNIRPAESADVPGILDIYNEAVATTTATYDLEPSTLEERAGWLEDHQQNHYPVFVAEENGIIRGWSSLNRFHPKPGYRFTVENSLYVASGHRGRGLGRLLLEPLIAAGQAGGFRAILALIDAENTISLRLHEAFGFEKVGHLKRVGFKFDRWLDVVHMERLLD